MENKEKEVESAAYLRGFGTFMWIIGIIGAMIYFFGAVITADNTPDVLGETHFNFMWILYAVMMVISGFGISAFAHAIADGVQLQQDVKDLLTPKKELTEEEIKKAEQKEGELTIGELVVRLTDEKQMRIKEITEDGYVCTSGGINAGVFKAEEIELFDKHFPKKE